MSKRKPHAPEFKAKVALEARRVNRRQPSWRAGLGCIQR